MKKYRGILLSVSVAAMLMGSCAAVYADETEAVTEVVTEVVSEEASEAAEEVMTEVAAAEVGEDGILLSDKEALQNYAQSAIEMIVNAPDAEIEELINPSSILSKNPESVVSAAASWKEVKDVLGAYVGVESFKIDTDEDIVIDALCNFENGDNTVTVTISDKDLTLKSLAFETQDVSFGQKMKEAVLNTLMGVSIVFLMLLFLSALISQFANINKIEQAMKKKNAPAPAPTPAAPAAAPVVEEEVVDDGELIAVIAAAIAAAEGTSTDGFVVRSIKKSNRSKWQRA